MEHEWKVTVTFSMILSGHTKRNPFGKFMDFFAVFVMSLVLLAVKHSLMAVERDMFSV